MLYSANQAYRGLIETAWTSKSGQQRRYLSSLLPACLSQWHVMRQSSLFGLCLSLTQLLLWAKGPFPCCLICSSSFRPSSWFLSTFPQREWIHPITQTFFLSTLCSSSPLSETADFIPSTHAVVTVAPPFLALTVRKSTLLFHCSSLLPIMSVGG